MFARFLSVATLALLLPLTIHAASAATGCPTGSSVTPIGNAAYLVIDPNHSTWVYEESNGYSGLQRGGDSVAVPGDTDGCTTDPNVPHDQLVY